MNLKNDASIDFEEFLFVDNAGAHGQSGARVVIREGEI